MDLCPISRAKTGAWSHGTLPLVTRNAADFAGAGIDVVNPWTA